MIDLRADELNSEEDEEIEYVVKEAFTKTFAGFIKIRVLSEIDERSFNLAMECFDEITQIMDEYELVIQDELIDTAYWEIKKD